MRAYLSYVSDAEFPKTSMCTVKPLEGTLFRFFIHLTSMFRVVRPVLPLSIRSDNSPEHETNRVSLPVFEPRPQHLPKIS